MLLLGTLTFVSMTASVVYRITLHLPTMYTVVLISVEIGVAVYSFAGARLRRPMTMNRRVCNVTYTYYFGTYRKTSVRHSGNHNCVQALFLLFTEFDRLHHGPIPPPPRHSCRIHKPGLRARCTRRLVDSNCPQTHKETKRKRYSGLESV